MNFTRDKSNCTVIMGIYKLSPTNGVMLIVMYSLVMVFIITSNTTLIIGLWKTKQTKSLMHRLFISISICDLIIGAIVLPIYIGTLNHFQKYKCMAMAIQLFFLQSLVMFNAIVIFEIGIDRYFSVTQSDNNRKYTRKPIFTIFMTCAIIIALIWGILTSVAVYNIKKNKMLPYVHIIISLFSLHVMFFTLLANFLLIRYVHKTTKEMRRYSGTAQHTNYDSKATQTIRIISIVLVLSYLPAVIISMHTGIIFLEHKPSIAETERLYNISSWVYITMYLNSGFNAVVFMARNNEIRTYYKTIFQRTSKHSTEIESTEVSSVII